MSLVILLSAIALKMLPHQEPEDLEDGCGWRLM